MAQTTKKPLTVDDAVEVLRNTFPSSTSIGLSVTAETYEIAVNSGETRTEMQASPVEIALPTMSER